MLDQTTLPPQIQTCPHTDELTVFVGAPHNIALCNDCYFEQVATFGKKGQTLRKASTEQISSLENVLITVSDSVQSCEDLQTNIGGIESLEAEVIQMVERQFEQLKSVIDEKKADASNTIKHLESVKNYRPPATDFTSETLTSLQQFK